MIHPGYWFVVLACLCAGMGAVIALFAALRKEMRLFVWARRLAYGFAVCVVGANAAMEWALLRHDFSVKYVAQVGSRSTPLTFTIVSLWSALEGSILFWSMILGLYLAGYLRSTRSEVQQDSVKRLSYTLMIALIISAFFVILIAGPANPFVSVFPVPPDGPGPNPLLQNHALMIIHPPMLYLGYVGMAIPFSIAIGAMLAAERRPVWLHSLRLWMQIPWLFLTIGIILGSWWAYAVLGWGGYWAWDPVENASFLPWLTATAFLHSIIIHEKRGQLKMWTLSLAAATFLLTLLGTFMTRSGVFNSVHSFTQSEIGPMFLAFIAVVLIGSLILIAARAQVMTMDDPHHPRPASRLGPRDAAFLLNNLLLTALTFTVLIGTLYPLISEALRGVKVSVGAPYFNRMTLPLFLALLFLMGVGPALPWNARGTESLRKMGWPTLMAALALVLALALGARGFYPCAVVSLGAFAAYVTVREALHHMRPVSPGFKERLRAVMRARRFIGGYIVHLAVIIVFVAVSLSHAFVIHAQATVAEGETFLLGGYQVQLLGLMGGQEPHRAYVVAPVEVIDAQQGGYVLSPRINYYQTSNDPLGSPAVHSSAREDVYISLLAFHPQSRTATFNAWIFPAVAWLWWTIPLFVLGTLLAAWPKRQSREPPSEVGV